MIAIRYLASALVGWVACIAAPVAAQDRDYHVERNSEMVRLSPGQNVIVNNGFGDVRVRYGGNEGNLEFFSVLQQFDREGAPLQVQRSTTPDAVTFVVYSAAADGQRIVQRQPRQRRRADLTLLLPQDAALSVQTDHGLIQVRGVRSDVRVRSISGNIQARSIRGDIDLESGSGNVLVALPADPRSRPQRIAALHGTLRLILAEDGGFTVRAQGDGPISTEFPLHFERDGKGTRIGTATHGAGTTPVELRFGQGELHLERQPSARQSADYTDGNTPSAAVAAERAAGVAGRP